MFFKKSEFPKAKKPSIRNLIEGFFAMINQVLISEEQDV